MATSVSLKVVESLPPEADLLAVVARDGRPLASRGGLKSVPGLAQLATRQSLNDDSPRVLVSVIPTDSRFRYQALCFADKPAYFDQAERLRIAAAGILNEARRLKCASVAVLFDGLGAESELPALVEGLHLGGYHFAQYKSGKTPPQVLVTVAAGSAVPKAAAGNKRAAAIAAAVNDARDLVNHPPNVMRPSRLATDVSSLCRRVGLDVEIWNRKQLEQKGCGGILAVGKGAADPPRMVIVRHRPRRRSACHLALVGKAVTFDTGGHCLKQAKDMWQMKGDMAGGAAVAAAVSLIGRFNLPVTVSAYIPIVENAIGKDAMLPGEIITAANGKTVHVDNTDAEGRLILMDALVTAEKAGATHIVDVATLTGAVVRAIGPRMSGLFSTSVELADIILDSGQRVGELFWPLPLHEEYREYLRHDIADIDNSGKSVNAGAITAALFLKEFVTDKVAWAHLDIAGTFLTDSAWKYYGPGATGFGVRTLFEVACRLSA